MAEGPDITALVDPIRNDLTSGAAELALRSITIFQTVLQASDDLPAPRVKERLSATARALMDAQPAMASIFFLANSVLTAAEEAETTGAVLDRSNRALMEVEAQLCDSASAIADLVFDLVPAGELVFAYSFSSTVVSALLNARARGKYFRVACTEARPAMEGKKLASRLAAGGIEVMSTFDCALGLILPNCRAAFMGSDCVAAPGVVNKTGSWILALGCKELGIPLYALAGSEKFVSTERLFEFERHERPGSEVWSNPPEAVRVLNHQFELVPLSWLAGVVTEHGILQEKDVERLESSTAVHPSLRLEGSPFA